MHAGAAPIDDETKLILYALNQQALHGECQEPKPWAWSVVDAAKWNSWKQLKDMANVEAMRLYVKVLEDSVQVIIPRQLLKPYKKIRSSVLAAEQMKSQTQSMFTNSNGLLLMLGLAAPGSISQAQTSAREPCEPANKPFADADMPERFHTLQPDWWLLSRGAALQKEGSSGSSTVQAAGKKKSLRDLAVTGSWSAAEVGGARSPNPRYEHAVTLFRRKLYMIGGNCSEPNFSLHIHLLEGVLQLHIL